MDDFFNYGWTFELWVNFWIMGEITIYGWTFEFHVKFLSMGELFMNSPTTTQGIGQIFVSWKKGGWAFVGRREGVFQRDGIETVRQRKTFATKIELGGTFLLHKNIDSLTESA